MSGIVIDEAGETVAFANVIFKNSNEGTITNDNGRFYMESDYRYETLLSFIYWVQRSRNHIDFEGDL